MCFITYNIDEGMIEELIDLFEIDFYEKSDGTYPAEKFILSQDLKMHYLHGKAVRKFMT